MLFAPIFARISTLLYLLAISAEVLGRKQIALVTVGTFENSLLLIRSALASNSKVAGIHLCVSNPYIHAEAEQISSELGVTVHVLHSIWNHDESTQWNNLVCMNQVADYYFLQGKDDVLIALIGTNFVVTNDLESILTRPLAENSKSIWCAPTQTSPLQSTAQLSGTCEMDLMVLSTAVGTSLYAAINATAFLNITADQALEAACRSLSLDMRLLPIAKHMVRASHMWYGSDTGDDVTLVEFDGTNHAIKSLKELCTVSLHVQWPLVYNTATVVMNVFNRLDSDGATLPILAGCSDDVLKTRLPVMHATAAQAVDKLNAVDVPSVPRAQRLFDSVMLNDELPLLRLRLEYLSPNVDAFIVVEARSTFTGKPKPLYYVENKHLFAQYAHKIVHVEVDLPFATITHNKQVWLNEYYSRNAIADALEHAQARDDDIIMLNDIDEIPHPRAIASLRALFAPTVAQHNVRLDSGYVTHDDRIYKLFAHTYMYNFSCSMHTNGLLSASAPTATTLGISKSLGRKYVPQSFADPSSNEAIMYAIEKHHITLTRLYMQTTQPYPLHNALNPGGWHLTFFGGIGKIKRKLESYSHQNFLRQFIPGKVASSMVGQEGGVGSCGAGVCDSTTARIGSQGSKREVPDADIFPTELITEELSVELIAAKVAAGRAIDHRSKQNCRVVDLEQLDSDTAEVKSVWDAIVATGIYDIV